MTLGEKSRRVYWFPKIKNTFLNSLNEMDKGWLNTKGNKEVDSHLCNKLVDAAVNNITFASSFIGWVY